MIDPAMRDTIDALLCHASHLASRRWRGLAWLSGDSAVCHRRALAIWRAGPWQAPLWVAPHAPQELACKQWLPPAKARTRLGGEHDLLVFDAVSAEAGFDPDAFGALAGTLRAGGLLVLMTPTEWGAHPDADYQRLAVHPWRTKSLSSHYLARLCRCLGEDQRIVHWPAARPIQLPVYAGHSPAPATTSTDADCLTDDQARMVWQLTRLRRRRPLVVTADRGRGKSAGLGIACARLLARGQDLLVTAPAPSALEALFERLTVLCPTGQRRANRFSSDSASVEFLAPDELLAQVRAGKAGGPGSWLLVDEAAALPAAMLAEWLAAFPRIAFVTTVHGYEGSGRGFALRFRVKLERHTPDWQALHLDQPIRWSADDPLEPLVNRMLMLDAEPVMPANAGEYVHLRHERGRLAHDEPLLRASFGLLVQAHYRTTPGDLRHLLDAPGVGVVTLNRHELPVAVLITNDEGGFDAGMAERVARGERRPRGHLMAQSLAAHAGSRDALQGHLRRVQRIAVHPDARRCGLGRQLIEREREHARDEGLDLLGASFGADPALMAFWRAQGFRALRLGLTRETATGEHALMVAVPLNESGQRLVEALTENFQRALPGLLAFELCELAPEVVVALLAEGPAAPLTEQDRRDIDDVAHGHREPALARPALQALVRRVLAADVVFDDPDLVALAGWAFQGRGVSWLAAHWHVSGRRQAIESLRRAVARLAVALARSQA
ncbi:tRNA(Met) cytidine acetyltransferase TmcA [Halomonas urumqiensis]|uniref:tRNA(Met) cytidine acetyltransferase TmcA n=1 Tax=Halomonas urumqiensis TaxID=1684789 RepID=A0A2N7ULB8_9GAMM|nr:GNAT family N-acetyltransferase [Halomonas urumqiensis]PMR81233.1 tRNA cytosine(34) acetyltransferase TmcA [Halomonas urumqiensis]PTB01756.1 tRNA(Met) cytidine acetyltransferase [Halomonas urumqiensis]GHE22144.1 tRNA(Met) cytidine acetyltransferase TmcA [Halomonas urumqiensis]